MNHKIPYSFQIEMVEGCNRLCNFCGLWSIWKNPKERKFGFMSTDLAEQLSISLNNWIKRGKRIEFAMHGEPLLNRNVLEIISIFRKNYPSAQYQLATNGNVLLKKPNLIKKLFTAGLNILVIDTYDNSYSGFLELVKKSGYKFFNFYNNDTNINIYSFNSNKIQYICLLDDISKNNKKKMARIILNHAGNSDPNIVPAINYPLQKKCSRVYREMDFQYDGTVPICCLDWRHEFTIGKFPEQTPSEIWNSEIFEIIRYLLYNKHRIIRPCYSCDYGGGFRLGFLKPIETNLTLDILKKKINKHLDIFEKYMHIKGRKKRFFINGLEDFLK